MSNKQDLMPNYGFDNPRENTDTSLTQVEQSRAVAEVQSAYVIAKRFPRDSHKSFNSIMKSCERPFLAEQAMYAYPRGNTVVTGPSIRLAEVLLQMWGNCDAGVREISQSNGVSVAEAYAIDLETNTRITKLFHVPHERHTKKGKQKLTDPRDIYELVANQGARRMRACILGIIPGDIVDAAIEKCKKTLTNGKEPIADRIRKMVELFDEQGVKIEHIEKRLGHKLDATIEAELITLKGIFRSLRDGMAKREDFFEMGAASEVSQNVSNLIATKVKGKGKDDGTEVLGITASGQVLDNVSRQDAAPKESEKSGDGGQSDEFRKLKKQLQSAKSRDTLDIAADLIQTLDEAEQEELISIYNTRKSELE